jgi:hypothetical protein
VRHINQAIGLAIELAGHGRACVDLMSDHAVIGYRNGPTAMDFVLLCMGCGFASTSWPTRYSAERCECSCPAPFSEESKVGQANLSRLILHLWLLHDARVALPPVSKATGKISLGGESCES